MAFLQWTGFLCGLISAAFWAASAFQRMTKKNLLDRQINDDLSDIIDPLNKQSRLNALGALFAAISVAAQAIYFLLVP